MTGYLILIILFFGAVIVAWMRSEYRSALAFAEKRKRQASQASPRLAGKDFYMDTIFTEEDAWPTR